MDLVLVYTITTAFIFGSTPILERVLLKGTDFPLPVALMARVLPALLISIAFVILSGSGTKLASMGAKEYVGFGILGILGSLVGPYLLFAAYRQPSGNISLIGPLLATFPIFTVLGGYFFLGESISRGQFTGIVLVLTGAVLLSLK